MGEAKENINIVSRTNWKESAGTLIFLFLYLLSNNNVRIGKATGVFLTLKR